MFQQQRQRPAPVHPQPGFAPIGQQAVDRKPCCNQAPQGYPAYQQPYDDKSGPYQGYPTQGQMNDGYPQGYAPQQGFSMYQDGLKNEVLLLVEPLVQYGLKEGQYTGYIHAMREVAAISLLIGRGYHPRRAHQIVESWELNEYFYPGQRPENQTNQG